MYLVGEGITTSWTCISITNCTAQIPGVSTSLVQGRTVTIGTARQVQLTVTGGSSPGVQTTQTVDFYVLRLQVGGTFTGRSVAVVLDEGAVTSPRCRSARCADRGV